MGVIPFYGAEQPDLFAIERAAMDRPGKVIEALDRRLPDGLILDVGAGDGFTASRLMTDARTIVALEPAAGMIRRDRGLPWVRGDAERLPFADGTFGAAYATWAYFFSRDWDPSPGIAELHRVVRPGGPLLVVDNLGDDEFTSLTDRVIAADPEFWDERGFEAEEIDTVFEFEDLDAARSLLDFYFGERGREGARLRLSFRVGLFSGESRTA